MFHGNIPKLASSNSAEGSNRCSRPEPGREPQAAQRLAVKTHKLTRSAIVCVNIHTITGNKRAPQPNVLFLQLEQDAAELHADA